MPFTKTHKKIKNTLIFPHPPAFSSLLSRMPHPVTLHLANHYTEYLAFSTPEWAGSPSLWSPGALKPSQGRKLARHASPSSSEEEMHILLTRAQTQLTFSFLFSSPFQELIEVDSEVVFELAAYILQVSARFRFMLPCTALNLFICQIHSGCKKVP